MRALDSSWFLALFAASCFCWAFLRRSNQLTGGYVRVRPDGIYLIERKFQSGDREVRLAGMMHVARGEFYAGLLPPADPEVPSVVLLEGVTDRKRLLGGRTLDYGRLAKVLECHLAVRQRVLRTCCDGIRANRIRAQTVRSAQKPLSAKSAGIYFRHADVDIETFHPQTIAFILAVMAIFQSNDLRELVGFLADPSSPIADANTRRSRSSKISSLRGTSGFFAEIESSLKDYRCVVVPWGAMHLPEVESWLRDRHFVQSGEIARKALGFW